MKSTIKCPTSVAILMAAYNAEKYIAEQIDSVIGQTSHDWTLYIRNDGSLDGTQSIIDDYTGSYPQKIVQIDKGGGNLGCNRNFFRLLEIVDADYYMFCDADDYWMPEKVSRNLSEIRKRELDNEGIPILVHNDMMVCDSNLNMIAPSLWEKERLEVEKFKSFNMLLVSPNVGGSTSIFNASSKKYIFPIPNNNGIYFDHWISLRIAKYGKIFVDRFIAKKYRIHAGQECGINHTYSGSSFSRIKQKIVHTHYDAMLFKSVGISPLRFYFYKIIRILRK